MVKTAWAGATGALAEEQAAVAVEGLDGVDAQGVAPPGRVISGARGGTADPAPAQAAVAVDGLAGVDAQATPPAGSATVPVPPWTGGGDAGLSVEPAAAVGPRAVSATRIDTGSRRRSKR